MDFKGFVEKAKDAAAAAAEKAREVATAAAEQVTTAAAVPGAPASDIAASDQPASPAAGAAGQPRSVTAATNEALSSLRDIGAAKIQELVVSFQQALPAIKMAGYELTEFEIELGVTPKLIPHFHHAAKCAEDVASAREALRDNKLGALMLNTLLKAGDVHNQIKVAGYCFSHVEIELGLIPSVRLQYKNESLLPPLIEAAPGPALLTSERAPQS